MLAYALTIFTGAFLLFQVQPIIGKYILPWFGGTPGVWTTCMLFFQTVLLGGYAYAHITSRHLKPKHQAVLHGALLLAAMAFLPIVPAESWKPQGSGNPTAQILLLLGANLGLPYLILSATGPLIQQWCTRTHPHASPYRLYALSNAGSLLALLSYPFFFEWALSRRMQAGCWAAGLGVFVLLCGFCAVRLRRQAKGWEPTPAGLPPLEIELPPPASAGDRALWVVLPALASILLLATTNKLCQDLAVIPFLWVFPLSLYLLSFILSFDGPRWYVRWLFSLLAVAGVAAIVKLLSIEDDVPLSVQIAVYGGTLFAGCMFCHGEVCRLKPHPRQLTAFYLLISAGGALGAFLVAIVAPGVFHSFLELNLGYWALTALLAVVCCRNRDRSLAFGCLAGAILAFLLIPALGGLGGPGWREKIHGWWNALALLERGHKCGTILLALAAVFSVGDLRRGWLRQWRVRSPLFLVAVSVALGVAFQHQVEEAGKSAVSASRNFFGVLTVFEYEPDDPREDYFLLLHGKITHGIQFADAEKAAWPTSYYGPTSGVGRAINSLPAGRGRKIGLVGLGTGTLAAYGRKMDTMRIYEINPQVRALATTRFRYLSNCPGRVQVVMGDARLSLEKELKAGDLQHFDLLALDAFSSDAIPVHLLTREAFGLYLQHLNPDGVIAVHISNRYFDLQPVVENLAKSYGLASVTVSEDERDDAWWIYDTTWVLVARNARVLANPRIAGAADKPVSYRPQPLWTDDYTSLFKVLR